MKLAWQLIVLDGDLVLDEMLTTVEKYGKVYCAEGAVDWYVEHGVTGSTDNTIPILKKHKVKYTSGIWSEKDEMCNAALSLMPQDIQWVWCVDADELYLEHDIETVLELLEKEQYDSVAFRAMDFFAGFSRYVGGFGYDFPFHRIQRYYHGCTWLTHRPPTILAQDGFPWREHKHLSHEDTERLGIFLYHYSYTMPKATHDKAQYYDREAGTIPNWFADVWMKWALGDEQERGRIEQAYHGVHNWDISRRGNSFTVPFTGQHPKVIRDSMPRLQERFDRELAQWQNI